MNFEISRRVFVGGLAAAALSKPLFAKEGAFSPAEIAPFRTPYKLNKLVLKATGNAADFDAKAVDDPFVFRHNGQFYMTYIGFDGSGYQTGLARSRDLLSWERLGCIAHRDPNARYTKYNVALSTILHDSNLTSGNTLKKVNGRYLAAWNAYPNAGYEEGAAVIGLAWSHDLLHWELTDPILFPEDGASWEHGGLYRPNLVEDRGTYYLYYNAKTDKLPKSQGGGWREQSGVATSRDLKTWTRSSLNPLLPIGDHDSRDAKFASNPFVVRHGKLWGMYYFGFDFKGKARELLALGRDPYHFTKIDEVLVDTGAPGTVDETFAHKTSVVYHEGALYHFYCAVSGKWPNEVRGIAVAKSKPW